MGNEVEELNAEIAGQKISLKSVAINTIVTLLTFALCVVTTSIVWQHTTDARETGKAFVSAIKEQTEATTEQAKLLREANCLQGYQGPPAEKQNFCARVTR